MLFDVGVVGIMAANIVNSRLVTRLGSDRLLLRGIEIAAAAGAALAIAAWTNLGGLAGLVLPLFVFVSMAGFIVANSIAGALADFPERAGAVSALVGAIHYGSGIAGSALVGSFACGTPRTLGWVVALSGIGSLVCARLLITACPQSKHSSVPETRSPRFPTTHNRNREQKLKEKMNTMIGELPISVGVHQVSDKPVIVEESITPFTQAVFEAVAIMLAVNFLGPGFRRAWSSPRRSRRCSR